MGYSLWGCKESHMTGRLMPHYYTLITHVVNLSRGFSPVNLSYVNLVLRPARRT